MIFLAGASSSFAQLCKPASDYDAVSWTWSYLGPCSTTYNCLSYALGITTSWTWPWGGSNPTGSQVTTYLRTKGYYSSGYNAKIISYGPSTSSITHFSKITSTSTCAAKWGSANLLGHGSWDPYYATSVYGSKRSVYYRTRYPQVTISGPTDMQYAGLYNWCADVLYGTPPYTFEWYYSSPSIMPVYMGSDVCVDYAGIFADDVYIDVMVTDAAGYSAYASIYVNVGFGGGGGGGGGGGMEDRISGLESTFDKEFISDQISSLLDEVAAKSIDSANPYDYTDSEYFRNIVQMGPRVIMTLRKMILTSQENGLKEYILAIASEKIAKIDLKGNTFGWEDAKGYCRKFDNHLKTLPAVAADILASQQSTKSKNLALIKLGIPVIPILVDEINCGNNEVGIALSSLLTGTDSIQKRKPGESLKDWTNKNIDVIMFLKDMTNAYKH